MVTRARVRQWLEQRFFLRMHMTLILAGTFLAGVVTTRLLMYVGVNNLGVRYLIAVSLAYLVFLVLVKLWLLYVGSDAQVDLDPFDALEFIPDNSAPALRMATVHSSRGSGGGSSSGWSLDFGDDFIFAIVLIVVVVLIGGLAIYFVWTAPALLSEAAFEAVLAASIARRAKKAEGTGWLRPIMRATVWPFLGVLLLSGLLGWLAERHCPDAVKLRDAINCFQQF